MKRTILALGAVTSILLAPAAQAAAKAKQPNFLVIIADDLGYSDVGAFGGEIRTPHLDQLARGGLRLTDFHSSPLCSVTRAMLISGTDSHTAGFGSMAEATSPNQRGKPGYEGQLSDRIAALPEILQAGGYRTFFSGKWHLGRDTAQDPSKRGFQRSFTFVQGAHNHFGRNISADPNSWGFTYRENGKVLDRLPDDFYSSDYFATKLIEQIRDSNRTEKKKPFFAWLAFSAPHVPLHAPAEDIARYKGRYDAGFEALRDERLKRQVELGLLRPDVVPHAFEGTRWDELGEKDRQIASRRMEVHAAMVDRLDQNVGRVIDELKRTGQYDDTVILFLSDNGAEGTDYSKITDERMNIRRTGMDNSLENIGTATSWDSYGPGWAQAATAPSWLFKARQTEGGTRVPAILRLPAAPNGDLARAYGNVTDVVPTFLDLAGVAAPDKSFQGRPVAPLIGRSWVPYLTKASDRVYPADAAVAHELMNSRAVRQGDWKITDRGDGVWHLFNVAQDPGETRDLSAAEPNRKASLIQAYESYAKDVGVIPREDFMLR